MNANGIFVPPLIIFPRKNFSHLLIRGARAGSSFRCQQCGWINTEAFIERFQHFVSTTKPSETNPVLLILDGHFSHTRNLALLSVATLHPQAPVFGQNFHGVIETLLQFQNNRGVSHYEVCELLGNVYLLVQTRKIAACGFWETSLYLVNTNIFDDGEFHVIEDEDGIEVNEPTKVESRE